MRQDNIDMLEETLQILDRGFYEVRGKTVSLRLSPDRMKAAMVLLPGDVRKLSKTGKSSNGNDEKFAVY